MKTITICLLGSIAAMLPCQRGYAYSHGNRYGGSTSHSYGSTSHSNAYGGSSSHTAGEGTTHSGAYGSSTSHEYGGGTSHTNEYGGTTSGKYGEGATHTNTYGGSTSGKYGEGATHTNPYGGTTSAAYGEGAYHTTAYGATAYHPPTAYYGYHPPTTVNYYGATSANVSGWATAAAATTAAVATVAAVSADTTTQAVVTTQQAPPPVSASYAVGQIVGALPQGGATSTVTVEGATYYQCGAIWFSPAFGANGVYYRVVPPPPAPGGQPPQGEGQFLALARQLKLTPDQVLAVMPILQAEGPKLEAVKNDPSIPGLEKLEKIRAVHTGSAPQLQRILSPEQYQALQAIEEAEIKKAIGAALDGR